MLTPATPLAAVMAIWPIAGIYGVISLWLAAFGREGKTVTIGLLSGILAALPFSLAALQDPGDMWLVITFLGPTFTAVMLLTSQIRSGVFARQE